jgi:hypothetical protein
MKIGYIGYSADEVQSIIDNIFAQRDALKAELATTKRALELACEDSRINRDRYSKSNKTVKDEYINKAKEAV